MPAVLQTARRTLIVATMLYCAGLLVLALLCKIGMHGFWWLDLANIFALLLFAPLLLLIPAALLWHSRGPQIAVLVACAAFVGLFGQQLLPRAEQSGSGPRLRVATFNLHSGLAEPQVAEIVAAIRERPADVYLFQELSEPAAIAIKQHLAQEYPHQTLVPSAEHAGMGMISRYPLDMPLQQDEPLQTAQVRVGDRSVTLINVSLTSPEIKRRRLPVVGWVQGLGGYRTGKRAREMEQLLRAADNARGPLVVAGDFNLSDREPGYGQLAARLHDAYAETRPGFGFTFPSSLHIGQLAIPARLVRIDYVWSAGGVVPTSAEVSCGDASDHCMVIADVRIADGL
ncbi:MAG: endonuclease/exonuclease/phosphatase family protein [Kouleothrix sp.]|nr:endonuclease/exonuclease/phosphatase family protein [Kouleothrix sp.]